MNRPVATKHNNESATLEENSVKTNPFSSGGLRRLPITAFVVFVASLILSCSTPRTSDDHPLVRAHAHNDYQHPRPLLDALAQGFCSVEADIWLANGELLVAHNREHVQPGRTLQSLYLDPLRERVRKNGGRVFRNGPEFTLLIDLKSHWTNTYPALRAVLNDYADMLSSFHNDKKQTRAVTVIISGSRAPEMFAGETIRYAAYDGTPADLDSDFSSATMPWISADWRKLFTWRGEGEFPESEARQLRSFVQQAHSLGRRVRFWGTPDIENFWTVLLDADVDLINTDNLAGLKEFLLKREKSVGSKR